MAHIPLQLADGGVLSLGHMEPQRLRSQLWRQQWRSVWHAVLDKDIGLVHLGVGPLLQAENNATVTVPGAFQGLRVKCVSELQKPTMGAKCGAREVRK